MKFRTLFNYGSSKHQPCGSVYKQEYVREIDPLSHKRTIRPTNKVNLVKCVELAGKGLLLKDLIARFNAGDVSAIPAVVESYGDFSKSPKTLMEAENLLIKARSQFDTLPTNIKAFYNNNSSTWLEAVSNGSFTKMVNDHNKAIEKERANAKFVADHSSPFTDAQIESIKKLIGGNS